LFDDGDYCMKLIPKSGTCTSLDGIALDCFWFELYGKTAGAFEIVG